MHTKRTKTKIKAFFLLILLAAVGGFAQSYETAEARDFETLVSIDTFYVRGDRTYGILNLVASPDSTPYIINDNIENESEKIILPAGFHRIYWDGGISYESIDTVVEVRAGEIANVNFSFVEKRGSLLIETDPDEAKIFHGENIAGVGVYFADMQAGVHEFSFSAGGYLPNTQKITVLPNRLVRYNVKLANNRDRDGDGFLDDVDLCPDAFGIFDGCPKQQRRNELRKLRDFWGGYLSSQPLSIEVLALALQYRIATDYDFRELINLFNDGPALANNHRGFSALNKIWVAKSFWIASLEYGQGFIGSQYKKSFDINVDGEYYLIYDQFYDIVPEITITSYSGQFGFRAGNEFLSFAILTGYQREKIKLTNATEKNKQGKNVLTSRRAHNNSWITTLRVLFSPKGEIFHPTFFGEISFTPVAELGTSGRISEVMRPSESGWIGIRSGIIIPWRLTPKTDN